jgi:hypothetical protein
MKRKSFGSQILDGLLLTFLLFLAAFLAVATYGAVVGLHHPVCECRCGGKGKLPNFLDREDRKIPIQRRF